MTRGFADLALPVVTPRLTLRRLTPTDARDVFTYRSSPEVSHWLTSCPSDLAEFERTFDDWIATNLAIEREGRLVGDVMLKQQDSWSQAEVRDQASGTQAELGWCLSPETQGHGYATEAAQALLELAFEGLGVRRVEAGCFAENAASRRIMVKLGMRQEGYFVQESLHRDGTWRDGAVYALLASEYRAR